MNDTTTGLDQTDENILTHEVSDEAMEVAGLGKEGAMRSGLAWTNNFGCC